MFHLPISVYFFFFFQGADIIVFPEYGIFSPNDPKEMKNYLENTPNPKEVRANPCVESGSYSDRPILLALSCMAKDFSMVVVANTGDIQKCEEEECSEDAVFHYNTNVAFDSDGTIIGRYHKEHLFFEPGMDLPRTPQDPTFATDFGKFGMFVCFDVVFKKITDIAKQVDAVLLPTKWIDPTPLMTSVQFWNSFAFTNNVTFMASNIQLPGYSAVGSGIFNAEHRLSAYTYNTDGKSKLVVAKVPRSKSRISASTLEWDITEITVNGSEDYDNDGSEVPDECSVNILGETTDAFTDYRCLEENTVNYTFVKLNKPVDFLQACNNGVCCSLDYEAVDMEENYYLGVYNGTYNMFNHYFWCEQNCILVRCEAFGNNSCATFPMRSRTRFMRATLSANITSEYVYPSVLASGIRLASYDDWNFYYNNSKPTIEFNGSTELLVVGLNGRCYDRDPPYI